MFLACTGYPDCKTTRRLKAGTRKALQPDELLDEKCPECESQLVKKHGQYGEFTGCTAYPKCKFIRAKTLGIKCPKCETGELTERVARKGGRRVFLRMQQISRIATSPRRTCRSPSHARNVARLLSSKSAASWARCEPASRRVATGKRQFRKSPPRPFPNPWARPILNGFARFGYV